MKAAELGLAACLGASAALAIVAAVSAVLGRVDQPQASVLIDPPNASAPPAHDLDLKEGEAQ